MNSRPVGGTRHLPQLELWKMKVPLGRPVAGDLERGEHRQRRHELQRRRTRSRFRRFFLPLLRTSACPLASVVFAFAPSLDVWRRIALERDPTVWSRIALERRPYRAVPDQLIKFAQPRGLFAARMPEPARDDAIPAAGTIDGRRRR